MDCSANQTREKSAVSSHFLAPLLDNEEPKIINTSVSKCGAGEIRFLIIIIYNNNNLFIYSVLFNMLGDQKRCVLAFFRLG